MKIIIIANFPSKLDGKLNGRFIYLADMLMKRGHKVEVIVSDFIHGQKKHREESDIMPDIYPFKITYIHEIGYSKNVQPKRLWSHYVWGCNVAKYLESNEKPDVIYCAVPSITAAYKSALFAQKNGIKYAVDLQDLWPEAFAMVIKNKVLQKVFLPMKWYVDRSYASANLAIAVSDTYVNRILQVNKKLDSGISVFLGNDGEEFDKGRDKYHLERTDEEIIVGYIGNMSTSYDMPCVMDALAKVKERGNVKKPIRFVLIGGGVDENKFKAYAEKVYPNTSFLGPKSYQEMAGMMCGFDIAVNPIVKGSVASIINKVGDYALSGKAVVNTQESLEYRKLVDDYHCGINCDCGNSDQVAEAIETLALDEELRKTMGDNAARLGREKFDRRYTYKRIIEAVEKMYRENLS